MEQNTVTKNLDNTLHNETTLPNETALPIELTLHNETALPIELALPIESTLRNESTVMLDAFRNVNDIIKQEIKDPDYEKISIKYCGKSIVVYSDSDSESSDSEAICSMNPTPVGVAVIKDDIKDCLENTQKARFFKMEQNTVDSNPVPIESSSTFILDTTGNVNAIKQEIDDASYESISQNYRGKSIVVHSDSDSSDSDSLSYVSPTPADVAGIEYDVEDCPDKTQQERHGKNDCGSKFTRTEGEVLPEELPPIEYLTITPDETVELQWVGVVSGIVDVLVVIKALQGSPALYDDTVLFLEGRRPLGLIFEIMGTVEQPFYTVRFNSVKDILDWSIETGNKVYFAPKVTNLTKYVFISELKKLKFDDASWEHDNEPPPTQIEYSDDEEERLAKRQKSKKNSSNTLFSGRQKRKRTQFNNRGVQEDGGPQLLKGDLYKNPFSNQSQSFRAHTQWPPKDMPPRDYDANHGQWSNNQINPSSSQPWLAGSNGDWTPGTPSGPSHFQPMNTHRMTQPAYFGEKPNWQMYPQDFASCPQSSSQHNLSWTNGGSNTRNLEQTPIFGNFSVPPPNYSQIPPPSMSSSHSYNSFPFHLRSPASNQFTPPVNSQHPSTHTYNYFSNETGYPPPN